MSPSHHNIGLHMITEESQTYVVILLNILPVLDYFSRS